MKLWKNFAFAIALIALAVSCRTYKQAPEKTIKVLAVTSEGDTIQLDVNSLRPRVYQTIYHNYPYYYNYWRPSPYYYGGTNYYYPYQTIQNYRPSNSNQSNSSSSGSGPNTSSPNVSTPRPTKPITKPSTNTNIKKRKGNEKI
jgi:hypothetical protein